MRKQKLLTLIMALSLTFTIASCSNQSNIGDKGEAGDKGKDGVNGKNGVSVTSIEKTGTEGEKDIYTITYSDGTTSTFTVTNGMDGENGLDGKNGHDGKKGKDGKEGVTVIKIEKTSTEGSSDNYTITYSDGTTSSFVVTNGRDGEQGIQGVKGSDGKTPSISIDENGYWTVDGVSTGIKAKGEKGETGEKGEKGEDGKDGDNGKDGSMLLTGNGVPSSELGKDGDSYLDLDSFIYYKKTNGSWTNAGSIKGDKGADGIYIKSTSINDDGDLIIAYSDDTTENVGNVTDEIKYTVNFHIGKEIVKTILVDPHKPVSNPGYTKYLGYTVTSWYAVENGNKYDWKFDSYFYGAFSNLDLYANYTVDTYTLTFVDDEKGQTFDPMTVAYGDSYVLPVSSVNGYTVHWLKEDGEEFVNGTYTTLSDLTLTASWSANQYTVTLDANGGTVESMSLTMTYDKEYTLPTPTRENYTFKGWYDSNGNEATYSGTWTITHDVTYSAVWDALEMTYTFDANGGTLSETSVKIKWEGAYSLPTPTYENKLFSGWYLNGKRVETSGTSWTYGNSNDTLIAQWIDNIYGSYPQTQVTDTELTSVLTSKTGDLPTSDNAHSWTSYKYYRLSSNTEDFMWYQDVSYSGEKYRAVYATKKRPTVDSYGNEGGGWDVNTVYWFKWEPLTWNMLDSENGDCFLVATKAIASESYFYAASNNTVNHAPYDSDTAADVYTNNYQYSSIRGWLNTSFYDAAFTKEEKSNIKVTTVDNSASTTNSDTNPYASANTNDSIFLLSYKEAMNTSYFASESKRITYATDYAKCQGIAVDSSRGSSYWRLRSPSSSNGGLTWVINYWGKASDFASNGTTYGTRPAMRIKIS